MTNRIEPQECSRTHQPLLDPTGPKTKRKQMEERKYRPVFEAACEHEDALKPGLCEEGAHSRPLRAVAPCGVSNEAVHILHALTLVLYGGEKPQCSHH